MNRDYKNEAADDVIFFIGTEVEHTPAYGKRTLFVVGIQPFDQIAEILDKHKEIGHIFFGANHSFKPVTVQEFESWETMIRYFLDSGFWCSLDIPVDVAEQTLEGGLVEWARFIPQIRIPLPYIEQWNYNTMIKLDDKGFNQTNPGVWCHKLHTLMNHNQFTNWDQYRNDEVIKNA